MSFLASPFVFPYGKPEISGRLKQSIDDFQVFESLGFEPSGEGEHLYLYIEKRDTTTDIVSQNLARHFDIKPYHISHSGIKDAKAITRQWFSVHLPKQKELPAVPESDDFKVLEQMWSSKKLKKGVHKGNFFKIKIASVSGDIEQAKQQIEQVKHSGFANYFGEQRFGKGKKNVANAMNAFTYDKKLSRSKKSLYLSSLRSHLFNETLVSRLNHIEWDQQAEGDCFMLQGTRSTFSEPITAEIKQRYQDGDIHPIIHLMGEGEWLNSSRALEIEQKVIDQHTDILDVLVAQGLKKDKRPIRQLVSDLTYQFNEHDLELSFYLPKGCYATTMIQHFCQY